MQLPTRHQVAEARAAELAPSPLCAEHAREARTECPTCRMVRLERALVMIADPCCTLTIAGMQQLARTELAPRG